MSVALRGELGDFGIAEVFQLVGQQRKTGLLKIRNGRKRAVIAFDRGVVAWGHGPSSTEHVAVVGQLVREGQITLFPDHVGLAQAMRDLEIGQIPPLLGGQARLIQQILDLHLELGVLSQLQQQ